MISAPLCGRFQQLIGRFVQGKQKKMPEILDTDLLTTIVATLHGGFQQLFMSFCSGWRKKTNNVQGAEAREVLETGS
jgi:hypothetical protein